MDDFEAFLSEQAEQHRMYPDDSVWRNIQSKLHGQDKWPALTFASIFTGAVISALLIFTHPQKEILNINQALAQLQDTRPDESVAMNSIAPANEARLIGNDMLAAVSRKRDNFNMAAQGNAIVVPIEPVVSQDLTVPSIAEEIQDASHTAAITAEPALPAAWKATKKIQTAVSSQPTTDANAVLATPILEHEATIAQLQKDHQIQTENIAQEQFIKNTMDVGPDMAWSKKMQRKSKWNLQFYATPSVSYRYLIDDKRQLQDPGAGPFAPFMTQSADAFVRQRPRLGLEAGVALLYELSDNFRVKTGLQLNYRQFVINAYTGMQQPATIELNRGNAVEALVQMTNISNQDGWRPVELNNQFLQLAIPVGFDLKMADFNKVDFYISATSQFTYQLASNTYLLSSDFKNFLQRPNDLERKFNINTAVEAFATFEAGGVQWQVGPQLRYQLLPGSKSAYPIREHLIDYGMKIGVIKQLR